MNLIHLMNCRRWIGVLALWTGVAALPAGETVSTALYARVADDYKRERAPDGSFKPEHYALSNGGRIFGTTGDLTVDRVTYPQVAEAAMRLLAGQNYHYAQTKDQARLLVVLQWGSTIASKGMNYDLSIAQASAAYSDMARASVPQGMGSYEKSGARVLDEGTDPGVKERFEAAMIRLMADSRVRDQLNERNARVLGYMDELADSNDIRRWAGGGDRYNDLIGDVEESRYFIVISAYDFRQLDQERKKLLWQVRVSVRSPGNSFDDSFVAMLKSASPYFGRDSGRLIRGEETKARVELGDLKYLGQAGSAEPKPADGAAGK